MPEKNIVRSRNGCYRCRARKIKCDEAQQECKQCISAGFLCPGYKSPTELVFRSMNQMVEHRVAKKQTRRGKKANEATVTSPQFENVSQSQSQHHSSHFRPWEVRDGSDTSINKSIIWKGNATHHAPALCVPMSTNWKEPALCRFFFDYVVEANEVKVSPGYLSRLPELYGEGNDDILTQAVSAVSLASFSNRVRSEEMLIRARKLYGKALLLVKRAISDPKQVVKDGTLAGVFFLNMYEMISGDKPMFNQWGTHADALTVLLRLRASPSQFTSKRSGGIACGAQSVVLFKDLLRRIPPGPESEEWAKSVNHNELWAQVGLAKIRIARLIPIADEALTETSVVDANGYRLLQLINMFEVEDVAFETWAAACVDPPYSYETIDTAILCAQRNRAGIPLPKIVHCYHDTWIAGFWNVYRLARVILLQTLAQLATRVSLYPELAAMMSRMERIRAKVLSQVDAMVNDICASIPYTLGRVDAAGWTVYNEPNPTNMKAISGYTSIWPLRLALMVKTLSEGQKRHIIEQLAYIEKSMGIKHAKPNV